MSRSRSRLGFCLGLLAVLSAMFTAEAALSSATAADPQPNGRAVARVMAVQERNTARMLAIGGVVGTATGLNPAGRPVVKVFAERADIGGIPGNVEGVPVVMEVTGNIVALGKPPWAGGGKDKGQDVDPTARFERPVPIGVSTGHPDITAGTIGCRVEDATAVYALSNNHVYANENLANIGDSVLQPGTFDGGVDDADAIGMLFDFEPILFDERLNTIDAAIALSSVDHLGNATPLDGYGMPKTVIAEASVNQKVKKYGRTSGQTMGLVWAINATIDVAYDSGTARFSKQIVVRGDVGFIQGGDSGSLLIVDGKGKNKSDDRKPVGLLFAGNAPFGDYAFANPIQLVLDRFEVVIDGE